MKKRMVVLQYYSRFDIAEEYIIYLLKSFYEVAQRVVVISNSHLDECEQLKIRSACDEYQERDNIGYDGGAFKDYFLYCCNMNLSLWDEVILVNSSFFGPLYSWQKVFDVMDSVECDFWGLSRHKRDIKKDVPEHLQSYFLAVRQEILKSPYFMDFWSKMEYAESFQQAIEKFEWAFTKYFSGLRFSFTSFLDQWEFGKNRIEKGGNVFSDNYIEILLFCEFPVIKYRFIDIAHYKQKMGILDFIRNHTQYDVEIMCDYIGRLEKKGFLPFSSERVLDFANRHSKLCMWGHGLYAKNLTFFLNQNGFWVDKYIVSNPSEPNEIAVSDLLSEDAGYIVALGAEACEQLREEIRKKVNSINLLWPYQ